MATEIKMPQLGLTMEEGTVERWLKAEGDPVKAGEPLLEITTDKLTNQVEAEADGVLLKIVAPEGADVPVQGLLGWIGQPGEQVGAPAAPAAQPSAPAAAAPAPGGPKKVLVIGGGPGGYVAADPGAFIEYYHGPEDIPKEHRVFAYPKEAEPARSILKAIREFQEAPPAPRKDKAGLSHEER